LFVGLAGLLDLGYVAFYAVGAYTYGLLARRFGLASGSCCRLPDDRGEFRHPAGFPRAAPARDYLAS